MTPDIICVREGSRARSVVFLPGLGDTASGIAPLANRLGGCGGVYIVDLLRLAEADGESLTVESLAKRALAALSDIGRVEALVGYSFGGLIALEVARLAGAEASGAPRPILIDAAPEQSQWPRSTWVSSLCLRAVRYTKLMSKAPPRQAIAEFSRRANGLIARVRRRREASMAAAARASHSTRGVHPPSAPAWMLSAFYAYRPIPYLGRLTLIESSDPSFATPVSMIWRPLAPKLELRRYSGSHLDVVRSETSLESLAVQLNACLDLA